MSEIIVTRIEPPDVSLELTSHLQLIALRGWLATVPRSLDELSAQFNAYDEEHLKLVQQIYKQYAGSKSGGLLTAYDTERIEGSTDPVGFVLAGEDVSGNRVQRGYKRRFQPEKVYAHLRHVCAEDPRRGIDSSLVAAALESFRQEQIPTAYIFDESELAVGAFESWGFALDPILQKPQTLEGYFGSGEPVMQRRYTAESAIAVIRTIQDRHE